MTNKNYIDPNHVLSTRLEREDMRLFHGTHKRRAIEVEGFLGSEEDPLTNGRLTEEGVVFCTNSLPKAQEYGETIFEFISLDAVPIAEIAIEKAYGGWDVGEFEFVIPIEKIETDCYWEIIRE